MKHEIGVGTHIMYVEMRSNYSRGVNAPERYKAIAYDCIESVVEIDHKIEGKIQRFRTHSGINLEISRDVYSVNWGQLVFVGRHKELADPITGNKVKNSPYIEVLGTFEEKEIHFNNRVAAIERELEEDAKQKRESQEFYNRKQKALTEFNALVEENNKVRNAMSLKEAEMWMNTACQVCKKNRNGFCTVWNRKLEPTNHCSALDPKHE